MNSLLCRVSVGIFSRDDETSYQWLARYLSTDRNVRSIHSVQVTNKSPEDFREGTRRCTFAILYHTKKRGRINITDVTDSLYDEELEHLSSAKGRENVIVVIDDLEDDGDNGHRARILQNQPSLQRLTIEVLCFTLEEKRTLTGNCPSPEAEAKLRQIQKIIVKQAWRNIQHLIIRGAMIIILGTLSLWSVRRLIAQHGLLDSRQTIYQNTISFFHHLKFEFLNLFSK
ncbi:uncharacterized protein LOC142656558 [Rhinoderma darwinii]|uniref:uncharacterized protein LOC142656558 n=1 Tax=Rhinoderma darwinii TaxID=43563 RepID=UPI003F66DFD6